MHSIEIVSYCYFELKFIEITGFDEIPFMRDFANTLPMYTVVNCWFFNGKIIHIYQETLAMERWMDNVTACDASHLMCYD